MTEPDKTNSLPGHRKLFTIVNVSGDAAAGNYVKMTEVHVVPEFEKIINGLVGAVTLAVTTLAIYFLAEAVHAMRAAYLMSEVVG